MEFDMIYTLVVKTDDVIEKILTLDCVNSFSKSMSGTVTKNPVENGFPISDHISLDNIRFDLSGIITSYSILDDGLELKWNGDYFETIGGSEDRLALMEADIEDTFKKREVITLIETESFIPSDTTSLESIKPQIVREYNNVVITNLTIDNQSGVNGAKFIRVSAEQVQVAFIQKAELSPEEQTPRLKGTEAKVAAGASSTTTSNTDSAPTPSAKAADNSEVKKYINDVDSARYAAAVDEKVAKTKDLAEARKYAEAAADNMPNNNTVYKSVILEGGKVVITPYERE